MRLIASRRGSCLYRLTVTLIALVLAADASAQRYTKTNLVSNNSALAPMRDENLVNAWGLSRSSSSPWWVSDNGTDKSTLYDGSGMKQPLVVNVPGGPTGTVFNGSQDFQITDGKPAVFLFVTEAGTVLGWNPQIDRTNAKVVASSPEAIYKGVAIAMMNGKQYLYVADFHGAHIDVYDTNFHKVSTPGSDGQTAFATGEGMRGFAPFNIQNIGGTLFIAYAKQDEEKKDEVAGPGLGLVAAFTPDGKLIRMFERVSALNAPWGIALAPGDFGRFSHHLLVGQFGSGEIVAYNITSGKVAGKMLDASGEPVRIDGLWALSFGSGGTSGSATTLYFTAGPNDEKDGLFGFMTPAQGELTQGNSN